MVRIFAENQRKVDTVVSRCLSRTVDYCCVSKFTIDGVSFAQRNDSPDMTLIATAWSPDGCALSADGRDYLKIGTEYVVGDVQKIFPTPFAHETGFAWAWCGSVAGEFECGKRFDLKEITARVMEDLSEDAHLYDPNDYFYKIARSIYCEMPSGIDLSTHTEAEVIFVGYLAGKPLRVEIKFKPEVSEYAPPVIVEPQYDPRGFYEFCGSPTIREQMRSEGQLKPAYNLSEAIQSVETYADTCVAGRGNVDDCKHFGETVHIATITKEGFTWIKEPKNFTLQ